MKTGNYKSLVNTLCLSAFVAKIKSHEDSKAPRNIKILLLNRTKALKGRNSNSPGQRPGTKEPCIKPRQLQTKIRVISIYGAEIIIQPIRASLNFQGEIMFHPTILN